MEAASRWSMTTATLLLVACFTAPPQSMAANARTQNFLVHAPTPQLARSVAESAERFRDELADYWLGRTLPAWPTPCPIEVVAGPRLPAQGVTTYNRSPVGNFQMRVEGTPERILDSVLPHEVTHTILATHFGRPLPRWADEGICTTVEHSAERRKHEAKLREFLSTRRGIAMNRLFLLKEYPRDMLPMYAQGYSVCRFLIEQSGPREFIRFLSDYMNSDSWTANVQKHYGYGSLAELQQKWLAWVADGSRSVESYVSTPARDASSEAGPVPAAADTARNQPARRGARNTPDTNRLAMAGSATAGAAPSWYQRRRDLTASGQIAAADQPRSEPSSRATESRPGSPPKRRIMPPSVADSGHYSVSQPQDEQPYGQPPGGYPRNATLATTQPLTSLRR